MGYSTEETYDLTVRDNVPVDDAWVVFANYFTDAHGDGELHTVLEDIQRDRKVSAFGYSDRYGAHVDGVYRSSWTDQMEALADHFDGTVDVVTEEGQLWRWRLRDGEAVKHDGKVVYPTDEG